MFHVEQFSFTYMLYMVNSLIFYVLYMAIIF